MRYFIALFFLTFSIQNFAQFDQLKKAASDLKKMVTPKKDSLSTNTVIDGLKEAFK